jgi:hypothetical protein
MPAPRCNNQLLLLLLLPQAGACLPALLEHITLPCDPSNPSPSTSPTAVAASLAVADAGSESSGDSPAAKRCCRALTPTSVLDL